MTAETLAGPSFQPHSPDMHQPGAWSPNAIVGFAPEQPAGEPAPVHVGQNYGRSYDPTRAHFQITPGETSPVAFAGVGARTELMPPTQNVPNVPRSGQLAPSGTERAVAGPLETPLQVAPNADPEAAQLVLHSLKLRDPASFAQAYARMSPSDRRQFDILEAREYIRLQHNLSDEARSVVAVPTPKPVWVRDPLHAPEVPTVPAPRPAPEIEMRSRPAAGHGQDRTLPPIERVAPPTYYNDGGPTWQAAKAPSQSRARAVLGSARAAVSRLFSRQPKTYVQEFRPLPHKWRQY